MLLLVREVADNKATWIHHNSGSYCVKSFLNLMVEPLNHQPVSAMQRWFGDL